MGNAGRARAKAAQRTDALEAALATWAAECRSPHASTRLFSDMTRSVLLHIEERACQPGLRLEDVAAAVGRSESHIEHMLKLETGRPFREHVLAIRLREAMIYLRDRRNSVKDAARLVGWHSEQLIRHFHRALGMTPGQWRQREWASLRRRSGRKPSMQGTESDTTAGSVNE